MGNRLKSKIREWYLSQENIIGQEAPPISEKLIKGISLFSGIGGIDIACDLCNIETVAFCEINPFGQKIIKEHWENAYIVGKDKQIPGGIPIFSDVKKLNKEALIREEVQVDEIQIIQGGFPCQSYSVLGSRHGNKDARALFGELCRLVDELRPTWVLGENVVGFKSLGLDGLSSALGYIGYNTRTFCYPALAQSAPIPRYRLFIVGFNKEYQSRRTEQNGGNETALGDCENRQEDLQENAKAILQEQHDDIDKNQTTREREIDACASTVEGCDRKGLCADAGSNGQSEFGEERYTWSPINTGTYNGEELLKPRMDRVVDGHVSGLSQDTKEAVKAFGNAVNPIQVYPLIRHIRHIHDRLELDDEARGFSLPSEIKEQAKKIIDELSDKQWNELKETFWIKYRGDDKEKLYHANKAYRPHETYIKIKCTPRLCLHYGTNIYKYLHNNALEKNLTCAQTGDDVWVKTDFYNLWKTNLKFTKIVFADKMQEMKLNTDKETLSRFYHANQSLIEEIWQQLVTSEKLCDEEFKKDNIQSDIDETMKIISRCNVTIGEY